MHMQPRLIRLRDAPRYLGMDKNRFNKEVKPLLSIIPMGKRGIAFDRLDLDEWVEHYKECNGRPANKRSKTLWGEKERRVCSTVRGFGTSTKKYSDNAFAKVLDQVLSKKPNCTLRGVSKK